MITTFHLFVPAVITKFVITLSVVFFASICLSYSIFLLNLHCNKNVAKKSIFFLAFNVIWVRNHNNNNNYNYKIIRGL